MSASARANPTSRAGTRERAAKTTRYVSPTPLPTTAEEAVLGRYRLVKQLGSGSFATVWSARDERLDRDVAVKVLPRERVIHARFEREARAAARLQHPAIVTLYEAAVDDHGAYLVSELVRGRTLDRQLRDGKLSDREIIEIGISLCDALSHAHEQGVIHRDVKPSNILVASRANSSAGRAKLTDFGVAHVVGGDSLTRTGDVIGTLAYMSPEQAEGREATPSSDLYSLALVLYEALSGINPLAQHVRRGGPRGRRLGTFVPPLRRQRRDLARGLGAGIDQALRPRPVERGTLEDLRLALAGALPGADEIRGVVGGWGGFEHETEMDGGPGPEWGEEPDAVPRTLLQPRRRAAGPLASSAQYGPAADRAGIPRAANAALAGLGGAWLCVHLLHTAPLAPPAVALLVALATLLAPRAGSLLSAVALGAVGLAGAYPALVGTVERSWLRRGLLAMAAFGVLLALSEHSGHNLYWLPRRLSLTHTRGIAAVAVWGGAAVLAPFAGNRRWPTVALVLSAVWASAGVAAVQATGATPLRGLIGGGVLAFLITALPALATMVREVRDDRGLAGGVS